MVAAAAKTAKPGEWILGRGWHQEKWDRAPQPAVEGFPTHDGAEHGVAGQPGAARPRERPRDLRQREGHGARRRDGADPEPAGRRDPQGRQRPPDRHLPRDGVRAGGAALRAVAAHALADGARGRSPRARSISRPQEALSKGITSFHDAGVSFDTVDLYKKVADEGQLGVRLYVMVRGGVEELSRKLAAYRLVGYGGNQLTVRAIKLSIDGALGSRGAWLLEPYTDLPSSTGLNTAPRGAGAGHRAPRARSTATSSASTPSAIAPTARRWTSSSRRTATPRRERPALARRARAAPQPRRHPAVRPARRDRGDAGRALHVGRALRAGAPRRRAGPRKAPTSGRS